MGRLKDILRNIKQIFQERIERIVVMEPTNPQTNRAHTIPNQQQYSNVNPVQTAIQDIFSPKHADIEQTAYKVIGKDGVVEDYEIWEREGNSMKVTHRKTKVITCTGSIVSPDQIKGICEDCKHGSSYSEDIFRCMHCGKFLCLLHVKKITLENGEIVTLCNRHLKAQLRRYNLWEKLDNNIKKKIGIKTESSPRHELTNPSEQ